MKRAVKTLLARAALGRHAFWANASRLGAMQVLCYHRIADEPDPLGLTVSVAEFDWQLQTLAASAHLQPVTATEFVDLWCGRRARGPRIPVLVSFDDGFRDNLTLAAPLLKRHGVPAILFATTDVLQGLPPWYDLIEHLLATGHGPALRQTAADCGVPGLPGVPGLAGGSAGEAARWVDCLLALDGDRFRSLIDAVRALPLPPPPATRYLSAADLHAWSAQGLEVGAHSCSHARLSSLSPADALWEMAESKHRLEALLGRPVPCLAYPFGRLGDVTAAHARAAEKLGFSMAFSTVQGRNRAGGDAFMVRRKCVSSGLFTLAGGGFSESLFLADLMGLGAEWKQRATAVMGGTRRSEAAAH